MGADVDQRWQHWAFLKAGLPFTIDPRIEELLFI
jgi:hypothetical protein